MSKLTSEKLCGVLLAGGLARRMGGGDKSLKRLGGRPILDHVIDCAKPQVSHLMINANGDPGRFAAYGLPVVADCLGGFQGPLAGILTGLDWMAGQHAYCSHLASFATDAPFIPSDLVAQLCDAIDGGADLACAMSGDRTHPVFGIWPVALREDLHRAMVDEDMRKIDRWTARYNINHVLFSTEPYDPFFNVNKPENLDEAEAIFATR